MQAVIFDLDETLLDRSGSLVDFVRWQVRGMLRNSVTDEALFIERFLALDQAGSVWKDEVYTSLKGEFSISDWSVDELLQSYELCFCGFCKLKPNVRPALEALYHSGYKLGLISNGKSPFQQRNFNALGIHQLFSSVVVSDAVGLRKPDPEIFRLACRELQITADSCVFVGDNPVADIDGAKKLGFYTVYIPGVFGQTYDGADAVCSDYDQLFAIVEKMKRENK